MGQIPAVDCLCLPCCYTGCCPCSSGITGMLATFDSTDCPDIDGEELVLSYANDGGSNTWSTGGGKDLGCGDNWNLIVRCTKQGNQKGVCNDFELEWDVVGSGLGGTGLCSVDPGGTVGNPEAGCNCDPLSLRFCITFSSYGDGCGCCRSNGSPEICIDVTEA